MQFIPIPADGSIDMVSVGQHPALPEIIAATCSLYERKGFIPPWIGYVAMESGRAVGTCGFAGPPTEEAEIAYFTFPGNEGQGVATRMAQALIELTWTEAQSRGIVFIAHTLPQDGPSTSILRKLKFQFKGSIEHPEDGTIWKWKLE